MMPGIVIKEDWEFKVLKRKPKHGDKTALLDLAERVKQRNKF